MLIGLPVLFIQQGALVEFNFTQSYNEIYLPFIYTVNDIGNPYTQLVQKCDFYLSTDCISHSSFQAI